MNIYEISEGITRLENDTLNVITCSPTTLILPKPVDLSFCYILFTEEGKYYVQPQEGEIRMGSTKGRKVYFDIGIAGYDTQPYFIFVPSKKCWFCISKGNIYFECEDLQ